MTTEARIALLVKLGQYINANNEEWQEIKLRAAGANSWFTAEHIDMAAEAIADQYLEQDKLEKWIASYKLPVEPKRIGIVMAGNIPMVGFHDMLCGFISGHNMVIKLSSKDTVLMKHLITKLTEWDPNTAAQFEVAEVLKGCDAYIATGSNNSARYFEQYFAKYPHIIRRNRTSVAVLDGTETEEELQLLGRDIFSFFGLGCRNITQVCIPGGYDIPKLLDAFNSYNDVITHHKYKHNYDYYLAIYLLNRVPYLASDSLLMVENEIPFSAVSVLHYRFYDDKAALLKELSGSADVQCITGHGLVPFGSTQKPALSDYADGIDTMQFMVTL